MCIRDSVGYFRHLLVRKAVKTGEILVDLVTASDTAELGVDPAEAMKKIQTFKDAWLEKMTAMNFDGTLVGILHTKNDSLADVVKDEGTEVLFGQDYFYEELLGLKFKITPFSFFQTNSLGAEVLYETAREYIGDTNEKVVFDLYSGCLLYTSICQYVDLKYPTYGRNDDHGRNHGILFKEICRTERGIFCKTAERPGNCERLYRRDDERTKGGKGILP